MYRLIQMYIISYDPLEVCGGPLPVFSLLLLFCCVWGVLGKEPLGPTLMYNTPSK